MSLPYTFRRLARREFDEAIEWYETRQSGRGRAFNARVNEVLERLSEHPLLYAEVEEGIRAARVHKYPYCVYYRIESEQIIILSVFHTSRDPAIWQERQ